MDLRAAAVANNVAWCAAVCGDGTTDASVGLWLAAAAPAPLFPDAVTVRPGVDAAALADRLSARPSCSVKDSYADVELEAHGCTELFTGQWIGADPATGPTPPGWTRVTDDAALETWCARADLPRTLPTALLRSVDVAVLARYEGDRLVAGAIANVSDAVVGASNVFRVDDTDVPVWDELRSVAGRYFPGRPVLGYEHDTDLDAARSAGFTDLGPVRVWLR